MSKFKEYLEQVMKEVSHIDKSSLINYVKRKSSEYKYNEHNSAEYRQFFSFNFTKEFNEKEIDEWNSETKSNDYLSLRLNIDLKNNIYFYILFISDKEGYNYDNLYSLKINFKKLSDIKIYTTLEEIKKILE